VPLGAFSRTVGSDERYHAVGLDPLNRKAYVSCWERLLGANRYLLEVDTSDLARPTLHHREDTGNALISHMDTARDVLWTGVVDKGSELFRAYTLRPGTAPLQPTRSIRSGMGLSRVGRVKVLDDDITAGCTWFGSRPDLFLFSTFGTETAPVATHNTVDWAFDVTGHAGGVNNGDGRVIVADEWGGFLTLDYRLQPAGSGNQPGAGRVSPGLAARPESAARLPGLESDLRRRCFVRALARLELAGRGQGREFRRRQRPVRCQAASRRVAHGAGR
jgi:hypothetical protein